MPLRAGFCCNDIDVMASSIFKIDVPIDVQKPALRFGQDITGQTKGGCKLLLFCRGHSSNCCKASGHRAETDREDGFLQDAKSIRIVKTLRVLKLGRLLKAVKIFR
jgi:hypothetical protein